MKVGEFCKALDVSDRSYYAFMKQNGPNNGTGSDTFMAAFEFFKKREIAGLKMPTAKKAKTTADKKLGKSGQGDDKYDVGDIKLHGEDWDGVPIFDTCDEVRRKINAYLREPGTSMAGFLREVGKTFSGPPPQGMSTTSLKTFLSQHGCMQSAGSPIFYAAFVFFEKLRIKEKKPKNKKREEMERVWGKGGMERISSRHIICRADERPTEDEYGRIVMRPSGKILG